MFECPKLITRQKAIWIVNKIIKRRIETTEMGIFGVSDEMLLQLKLMKRFKIGVEELE